MPIITVQLGKGRSEATKQSVAEKITNLVVEELDVEREWVTVLFQEYERENWASDGTLHSIKYGKGFGKDGTGR